MLMLNMPKEGRRSIGYRPFITCDDPRGVAECGTIRKQKNLNTVGGGEAQSTTSYHLLEVSRGAQKLNHVVSSWSCGHSKNNETDMAKDLLKGALDLEESLAVLSRLQHSSDCISESAKKRLQKKAEKGAFDDDFVIEELQDVRSHGRHLSGSSMDEFEEIKRVIRNGIDGKNVFSDPFGEEACDDRRLDSSEEPSTSSSQSSIIHSSIFVSPESFLSSTASQKKKNRKKPRGSNLIAKLMGLEYGRKHLDDGVTVVNQQKLEFDLDPQRARKHEQYPWKSGWKSRTLDQMIEALNFKGNVKTSLINGVQSSPNSHRSEISDSKQRSGSVKRDHWSPIVLMKPSRFSCLNLENPIIPKPRAEVDEEMLLEMRIRTNPLAEANGFESFNFNEKEMLDRAKGKASSPRKPRPHKKHSVGMNSEEAQKESSTRRKGERKRSTKSESHLQSLDEDKLAILKPISSRGAKNTEIDMLQNATTSNSKRNWPKNAEEVTDKAISLVNDKQRYRDECERESPLQLENSTRLVEDVSQIEITDYVDDDQSSSNDTPFTPSSSSQTNTNTAMIFPNERGTANHDKESHSSTSEDKKQLSSACGTTTPDTEEEEGEEEDYVCVTSSPSIVYCGSRKASTSENKLKELLLSSPPFINRVEELFDLKGNPDKDFLHKSGSDIDHNDLNARMLLDSANELAELHGYECSRVCLPLPLTYKMSSVTCYYTSLDQLLGGVCEGIESLGCYIKDGADTHSTDNLLLLVKEDLRSRRMATGVWDIGWRNVGSADEIEEITRALDQLVLDELIEEILVDLILLSNIIYVLNKCKFCVST